MTKVKKGQTVITPGKIYREGDDCPDELFGVPPKDPPRDPPKAGKKGK